MSINNFSSPPARNGISVTSIINKTTLVAKMVSDSYFEEEEAVARVDIYYQSPSGRQTKRIVHYGPSLSGLVSWTSYADAGEWVMIKVKAFDHDGAEHVLYEADLPGEGVTLA